MKEMILIAVGAAAARVAQSVVAHGSGWVCGQARAGRCAG
jgi:hypothetical protein